VIVHAPVMSVCVPSQALAQTFHEPLGKAAA
jgi:hypothetical protein